MTLRHFLIPAGVILALCAGCVDPEYNLDRIETEGGLLRNLEVPIGQFEEVTLETILKAQGAEVVPLQPGTYSLTGSAFLQGVNLRFDNDLYFKEAELHTVILNTLPMDISFSVTALDAEGQVCPDVRISVQAEKTPALASGRKGRPSSNPVVLRIECQYRYMTLETLRLDFTGRTGSGFESEAPAMDEGITLTQVVMKMPEGFHVNL